MTLAYCGKRLQCGIQDVALYHRDLAMMQLFLGDISSGRESMVRALELDPLSQDVLYNLVRLQRMDDGSELSQRILAITETLASDPDKLPPAERAQVFFSLAKAYEDQSRIELASKYYELANATKRKLIAYDVGLIEDRYRRIAESFDSRFFQRLEGAGVQDPRPIFIVGMPRSGSSLVEQILSAHPEVHGAGEIDRLPPIIERARGKDGAQYPGWVQAMNAVDCSTLGQAYLNGLPTGFPGQTRTTDKWLENFEYLGLICACLPRARIIHCRRDPRDQLFSCWTTLFSNGQEYAYDIEELVRYQRAYDGLMARWREVLPPGRMLEVQYERTCFVSGSECASNRNPLRARVGRSCASFLGSTPSGDICQSGPSPRTDL